MGRLPAAGLSAIRQVHIAGCRPAGADVAALFVWAATREARAKSIEIH
jgi:hypothetical protein